MRRILILALLLFLAGCNQSNEIVDLTEEKVFEGVEVENTEEDEFEIESHLDFVSSIFLPRNAEEFIEMDIDFEGDGFAEKILFYESEDDIGDKVIVENQHLKVYKLIDTEWILIKEDVARTKHIAVERRLGEPEIIDLGEDGKEELFVNSCRGRRCTDNSYYVFGYDGKEYLDLAVPKGYLNYEEYDKSFYDYYYLAEASYEAGILKEIYWAFCDTDGIPQANIGEALCEKFQIEQIYVNGEFISNYSFLGEF